MRNAGCGMNGDAGAAAASRGSRQLCVFATVSPSDCAGGRRGTSLADRPAAAGLVSDRSGGACPGRLPGCNRRGDAPDITLCPTVVVSRDARAVPGGDFARAAPLARSARSSSPQAICWDAGVPWLRRRPGGPAADDPRPTYTRSRRLYDLPAGGPRSDRGPRCGYPRAPGADAVPPAE